MSGRREGYVLCQILHLHGVSQPPHFSSEPESWCQHSNFYLLTLGPEAAAFPFVKAIPPDVFLDLSANSVMIELAVRKLMGDRQGTDAQMAQGGWKLPAASLIN